MVCWEYKAIEFTTRGWSGGILNTVEFNHKLNEYGKEGWELVNCFDTNQTNGASRKVIAVFKREKGVV
ncbi:MAG TPA: DUF4177 domain-containing protein [Herbinix luporum]|jgi:hypothetical protein|nr:DUF4177 domain-containing protein [Herbinix luporum]